MPRSHFSDDWKIWIWHNVARGCDKLDLFRILLDQGFSYDLVRSELGRDLPDAGNAAVLPCRSNDDCRRAAALGLVYLPHAKRADSALLELYTVDEFLSEEECRELIAIADSQRVPSTITNENEPDKEFRTSSTCHIGQLGHPLARDVDRRLCAYLGIHPSYSEALQAQHYEPGQQFKAHTDWFAPNTPEFDRFGAQQGQRTWTAMVYLNNCAGGGETEFPAAGVKLTPKRGQAVIWNNLNSDGQPNPNTLHRAHPVTQGFKATLTKWFRERPAGNMHVKKPREYIPSFTTAGFARTNMPTELHRLLKEFHDRNGGSEFQEHVPDGYLQNEEDHPSYLLELPKAMRLQILDRLKPLCEEWCGVALDPVVVYGIRRYVRGTTLRPHVDTQATHIISAILNVDQKIDAPWPLHIEDHFYRRHEIELAPGEMLLYEGARLVHGRPTPLQGDSYSNVFVHYRPKAFDS